MASRLLSKKGKIICGITTTIFSLFSLFTSVGAWFVSTNAIKGATTHIQVTSTTNIGFEGNTYEVFGFDLTNDNPIMIEDLNLALGNYNVYIPTRNTYCRRIIHFSLLFPSGVANKCDVNLYAYCTGAYKLTEKNEVADYVSNMIEFKYFVNTDSSLLTGKSVAEKYTILHDKFDTITETNTFFETTAGDTPTYTKNDSLKFSVVTLDPDIDDVNNPDFRVDLFLQYDYNEAFIADYVAVKEEGDEDYFKKNDVIFSPDITELSFKLEKAVA